MDVGSERRAEATKPESSFVSGLESRRASTNIKHARTADRTGPGREGAIPRPHRQDSQVHVPRTRPIAVGRIIAGTRPGFLPNGNLFHDRPGVVRRTCHNQKDAPPETNRAVATHPPSCLFTRQFLWSVVRSPERPAWALRGGSGRRVPHHADTAEQTQHVTRTL